MNKTMDSTSQSGSSQLSSEQTGQTTSLPIKKKKIKIIIFGVILLLIIGFIVYYFLPQKDETLPPLEKTNLLEFEIMNSDLEDWQKEKYYNDFVLVKDVLEQDPDNFDALLRLGRIKKYIGDYQGAEQAWLRVSEIYPNNSTSFNNLADLYTNFTKEYDKAEFAHQKAVENSLGNPKNKMFYRNFYYFYYYNLEDNQKAEAILLEGIENNPNNSELLVLLASFYKETGDIDQAIQYYQKALEINPENEAVKEVLDKLK